MAADAYDPSVPGQGCRDWRNEKVTTDWGRLNRHAARRFEFLHALHLRRAGMPGALYEARWGFNAAKRSAHVHTRNVLRDAKAIIISSSGSTLGQDLRSLCDTRGLNVQTALAARFKQDIDVLLRRWLLAAEQ